jgi:hypothetical protein
MIRVNIHRSVALAAGLLLTATLTARAQKGIEGSPHDFSFEYWNIEAGVCSVCHQAHKTDPAQIVPLWAHATSAGPFTMYNSPTFLGYTNRLSGPSLACLSCHDGSVAINQLISGVMGGDPQYLTAFNVGPNLHATHPVSFTYDATLATQDGQLENPTTYRIGDPKSMLTVNTAPVPPTWQGVSLTGKTVDQVMLFNHKVECISCHDVHKLKGNSPSNRQLLILVGSDVSGRDDLLCRTCHIK